MRDHGPARHAPLGLGKEVIKQRTQSKATLAAAMAKARTELEEVASQMVSAFMETDDVVDKVSKSVAEMHSVATQAAELDTIVMARKFMEYDQATADLRQLASKVDTQMKINA